MEHGNEFSQSIKAEILNFPMERSHARAGAAVVAAVLRCCVRRKSRTARHPVLEYVPQ